MRALWHRRAVRHLLAGLLPLLVAGVAVAAVVAGRFADTAAPVREAAGRATATVVSSGGGPDGRDVALRWTDEAGAERVSTVRAARAGEVPAGRAVALRYDPDDPGGRVFVPGDETSARLRDLAFGLALTLLLVAAALVATAVHAARRLATERRPAGPLPARYARSRRGVVRRSWLVVTEEGSDRWVPVHWDPVLAGLAPGTAVPVHGRPSRDRVVTFDVDGVPVWQGGRRRPSAPGGEVETPPPGSTPAVGLLRHVRSDAALLAVAPIAGLLWAYLDDGGTATWVAATALAAGLLCWLPAIVGTDPG